MVRIKHPIKQDKTTPNEDRSPGRFYSSVATKLILAHILKGFDCSFVDEHMEKTTIWRSYALPREDVLVQFMPRAENEV